MSVPHARLAGVQPYSVYQFFHIPSFIVQDPIRPYFIRQAFEAPVDHCALHLDHLCEQTGGTATDTEVSSKGLENFNCTYTKIRKICDIRKYIFDYQCLIILKRCV